MKISNETKVGILTIVALVILILGFYLLLGNDLFNRTTKIYAVFDQLGALAKSNAVKINGYAVGTVYDLKPVDKNLSGIRVTISLTEDVDIPSNSVAYISADLLGSSSIVIEKGNADTYLKNGEEIKTRKEAGIFGNLSSEAGPTLVKIRAALDSLGSVMSNINRAFDAGAKKNLQQTMANLEMATASLNKLLDPDKGALARTLNNASSITDNLKKNNDSITAILSNTKQFTGKLSELNVQQTIDSLQSAITLLKSTIGKVSSPSGSLGALISDKKLYNKLNDVLLSAEILLDDLRAHPKRYVNLSVFGKKDKGGSLTSPSKKDTIPK
jgi:phospholipid/cholesterol/gamma-HCH transport system substrate-binding protein